MLTTSWRERFLESAFLRRVTKADYNEPSPPRPLDPEDFLKLCGSLIDPDQREVIRVLLAELLAETFADLVLAGLEEVRSK